MNSQHNVVTILMAKGTQINKNLKNARIGASFILMKRRQIVI